MRLLYSLILLMALSMIVRGQNLTPSYLGTGGDYFQNSGHSLSITLGEFATETHSNTYQLTQGFQQAHFLIMGLDSETNSDSWDLKPYPNPATQEVWIAMNPEAQKLEWLVRLRDANGKLLLNLPFQPNSPVSLAAYSSGLYHLDLISNQVQKTFKVLKCY